MREITGNLWDYYGKPGFVVCITTNGTVKKNGEAVMGRGCAFEATHRIPGIAKTLGGLIQSYGNVVLEHLTRMEDVISFPVKHNWWEQADLKLIEHSAGRLWVLADGEPEKTFILPRPGCGNGRLTWEQVKPAIEFLPDNVWIISREA